MSHIVNVVCGLCDENIIRVLEKFDSGDQSYLVESVNGGKIAGNYLYRGVCSDCIIKHRDWENMLEVFSVLADRIARIKYGIVQNDSGVDKTRFLKVLEAARGRGDARQPAF